MLGWTVLSYRPVGITLPSKECAVCSPLERHGDGHQMSQSEKAPGSSHSLSICYYRFPASLSLSEAIRAKLAS